MKRKGIRDNVEIRNRMEMYLDKVKKSRNERMKDRYYRLLDDLVRRLKSRNG